jgi:NAD(P)-dependent dehydrogenase (short-subunit alcohol dehydrogenase family)
VAAEPTLRGRVALVTGASRGIGRAIALRLAAHGAALALTASARSRDGLEATRVAIEQRGGRATVLIADLADETARATLVTQAEAALGSVDILVNNAAGISAYAPPSKIDLAARRAMFELNLQAPIDLIQQALPGMRARGWGRIVNLSSDTSAQPPIPYAGGAKFVHALALYGASKAALDRYTTGLAAELHGSGVHVNALLPYKIARSESAEVIARQTAATHPDWVEPLELMAEAAYLLVAGAHQGEIAVSRALLQRGQQPLHALDGETVIGDALSLVEFS